MPAREDCFLQGCPRAVSRGQVRIGRAVLFRAFARSGAGGFSAIHLGAGLLAWAAANSVHLLP